MNVLETLYFVFKGDATELKKTTKEAKTSADELSQSLLNVGRTIKSAILPAISAGALVSGIKSAVGYVTDLSRVADALNISTEALDAWGNAVKSMGGTTQGFQSSIQSLASNFNISTNRAIQLLPRLADMFHRVGHARAMAFGQKLGLDQSTIMLLQQGRREVDAVIQRQKELGVVTKQDKEIVDKFNSAWIDTEHAFRSFFLTIARDILPILQPLLEGVQKFVSFLVRHSDIVRAGIVLIATAIVGSLIPAILTLDLASAPFIALVAVIAAVGAALALAYDDWMTFQRGGDSVIGRILDKWPMVGTVIKAVFGFVKDAFSEAVYYFNQLVALIEKILGYAGRLGSLIGSAFGGGTGNNDFMLKAQQAIGQANSATIGGITSPNVFNSGADRNTSVSIGDIIVNTNATDAEGTASALSRHLNDHFSQTFNALNDGVRG